MKRLKTIRELFEPEVEMVNVPKDFYYRQLKEREDRGYGRGQYDGYKRGLETIRLKFTGNLNETLEAVYKEYKSMGF